MTESDQPAPSPGASGRVLRLQPSGPAPDGDPAAHLVLGYDRAPGSQQALAVAADLAGRLRAQLHVVHIVDLNDYPIDPESDDWEEQAEVALRQEREQVQTVLAEHAGGWDYHAWRGDPVRLLAQVADDHDALMIVVGTRGGGFGAGFARLLGGSTSHGLIRHRTRPVLVVPQLADPAHERAARSPS